MSESHKALAIDPELLLDNAATCSQLKELCRDDDGVEGVARECVRLNVVEPLIAALAAQMREPITEGATPRTDAERIRILTARISYEDKFDEAIDWGRQLERALAPAPVPKGSEE